MNDGIQSKTAFVLYGKVVQTMTDANIPGLVVYIEADSVRIDFDGARLPHNFLSPRLRQRRERVLHELLMRKYKVKAAIAPTCATAFHLIVTGVDEI